MENSLLPSKPDDLPDSFLTLGNESVAEIKIQRSRFVGIACPADSEETARVHLDKIARRFHDARHVCFGYRLGLGQHSVTRRNDDGEPSGTAGEPIVKSIERYSVTDTLVAVVRYFGGVKLGTGGLARAYGEASDLALANAEKKEVLLGRHFTVRFPYALEKTIRHLLDHQSGKIQDQEYGTDVCWSIWLPHSRWRIFRDCLTEVTSGSVTLHETQSPEAGP